MELEVIIDFKDRITKQYHKVGDVIVRDAERGRQLILSKNCIEKIQETKVFEPTLQTKKNKKKNVV